MRLDVMRKKLGMLSFDALAEFYDLTLLGKIISSKEPSELYKTIKVSDRDAREVNRGNCKVIQRAKSEKTRNFFLHRSVRSFNNLPHSLKEAVNLPNFKDRVREHLYRKEVPPD